MLADRKLTRSAKRLLTLAYTLLYALSVASIAPLAYGRGAIWITPKLIAIAALVALTAIHAVAIRANPFRRVVLIPAAFLIGYAVSSTAAGFNMRPWDRLLFGHPDYGDGLVYWALIGALVVGNFALLTRQQEWCRPQTYGLLIGAVANSLAVITQRFDWTIDFTATAGQLTSYNPQQLLSSIYFQQMPVGLTKHRGIAGIVLAFGAMASFSFLRWGQRMLHLLGLLVCLSGLWLVATRAPIGAGIVGVLTLAFTHWLVARDRSLVLHWSLVVMLSLSIAYVVSSAGPEMREIPAVGTSTSNFTSGRLGLWHTALDGIAENPIGWGFDGYTMAYISAKSQEMAMPIVVDVSLYVFRLSDGDNVNWFRLPTGKSHNTLLDAALNGGVVGLVFYLAGLLTATYFAARLKAWIAISFLAAYGIFSLFWFDAVGVTHVPWWAYSVGIASRASRLSPSLSRA